MPERDAVDRSFQWYFTDNTMSLLRLSHLDQVVSCRPYRETVTVPKVIPDNLCMIRFQGDIEESPLLMEVEAYPNNAHTETMIVVC